MIFLNQILVFQFRPLFTKPRLLFIIITVTLVYLSSFQNTVYPLGARACVICMCALLGWSLCFLQLSSSYPQNKPHWSSKPEYFEGPSSWFRLQSSKWDSDSWFLEEKLSNCCYHPVWSCGAAGAGRQPGPGFQFPMKWWDSLPLSGNLEPANQYTPSKKQRES